MLRIDNDVLYWKNNALNQVKLSKEKGFSDAYII